MATHTQFTWDRKLRRYRYADTGELVPKHELRAWIAIFGANLATVFAGRASRLEAGIQNIDDNPQEYRDAYTDWSLQTPVDITSAYIATAAAAFGGLENASNLELEFGEQEARRQTGYFATFVGSIAGGAAVNGYLASRSAMYGNGVYANFINADRYGEMFGADIPDRATEEMRVLGASDHCVDCVELNNLGWVAIGSLPALGDSVCRTNCRCWFEYR